MRRISATLLFFLFTATPRVQAGESRTGLASWYDSSSACRFNPEPKCPTASGKGLYELEKKGTAFAAMWDVPFGSRLRVTSLETGKSAEVLVLDRGPNRKLRNRIVDLSKKAFKEIGETNRGLIRVKVEVLK